MIQINLVPDIKQELIRAERVRTSVISIAIITGVGAIGVVVLLLVYIFGVQLGRGLLSDNAIKDRSAKIAQVEDLSNMLTIQNQLKLLPQLYDGRNVDSRLFAVLTTVNPPAPNEISITTLTLDAETKTLTLEAQARNGYPALEAFRKTIAATNIEFKADGELKTVPLTTQVDESERSYGEDSDGRRVLRFTLSFVYADELFSPVAENLRVVAPTKTNATDSLLGIPKGLLAPRAADIEEEK